MQIASATNARSLSEHKKMLMISPSPINGEVFKLSYNIIKRKGDKTMYEYEIKHKHCGERTFIWGGNWESACRKANIDTSLWECVFCERIEG
jgi:hypothetical protein